MPRMHRLAGEVIDRIAAGEVVERPASVVKELGGPVFRAAGLSNKIEVERTVGAGRVVFEFLCIPGSGGASF